LIEQSLAQSAHSVITTRTERGLELYRERWHDIEYKNGSWFVPSATYASTVYEVNLTRETCECADFIRRGAACKHIVCASLLKAKTTPCSCCGERVPNRFATEVEEWHELLCWYPGDFLCGTCIANGAWA
jgi:hypothetical protein